MSGWLQTEVERNQHIFSTPAGTLQAVSEQGAIVSLRWLLDEREAVVSSAPTNHLLSTLGQQLFEYFSATRTTFDIPVSFAGTEFQQAVWQALLTIPYGTTASYRDIAMKAGYPRAVRAVGQANRANPMSILIPCHRVISSNGKMTGYMGNSENGLRIKQFLLDLERAQYK